MILNPWIMWGAFLGWGLVWFGVGITVGDERSYKRRFGVDVDKLGGHG